MDDGRHHAVKISSYYEQFEVAVIGHSTWLNCIDFRTQNENMFYTRFSRIKQFCATNNVSRKGYILLPASEKRICKVISFTKYVIDKFTVQTRNEIEMLR